jgi:hypothetical protein
LADLYFAEDRQDKQILKCGLDGDFVHQGTIVLKASNTDWSKFNNVPEDANCAGVVLYEHLVKPAGAALVVAKQGNGTISVSTVDYAPQDNLYINFWRDLLHNMGVKREKSMQLEENRVNGEHNLLLNGPKP